MQKTLRIVSRKSTLALWQANFVKTQLQALYPNLEVEILGVNTEGDKNLEVPLSKIGGKGLFVKTLEEHLLNQQADIAVHSLKDIPIELPEGLTLAAILEREDPSDVFLSKDFSSIRALPPQASVGTSSLRRQGQLYAMRSDLRVIPLRGNVDTRVLKMDLKEYDGIILAAAGLKRLNLAERITEHLSPEQMLPAIGQGALSIECRNEDSDLIRILQSLSHAPSTHCVFAERSMSRALGGGCQLPIAGFALIQSDGLLHLRGRVCSPDGTPILSAESTGNPEDFNTIGIAVAKQLLAQGAQTILEACLRDAAK